MRAEPTTDPPRCPGCAAAVRPGAPWCTQCYLDLRAPTPAAPAPVTPGAPGAPVAPVAPVSVLPDGGPTWPCTACGAANPLSAAACAACRSPFLAGLRETDPPLLVLPGVGDVSALSRGRRLGLAATAVLVVAAAVLGLGLL